MNGPGDRATKRTSSGVPTRFQDAEGHDETHLDEGATYTPRSKRSARSQQPSAREPGDLHGASSSMVDETQSREGDKPQAVIGPLEESDAGAVPKKAAKTWVTPVELLEGRPKAKGKSAARNTSPTQRGIDVPTALQRIGQRATWFNVR